MAVVGKFQLRQRSGNHVEAGEKDGKKGIYYVEGGQVFPGNSHLDQRFPDKFTKVDDVRKVTATFIESLPTGQQQTVAHAAELSAAQREAEKTAKTTTVVPTAKSLETLDTMSYEELVAFAGEEGVKLDKRVKTKEQALEAIKSALTAS